jgi:hypothetical protein
MKAMTLELGIVAIGSTGSKTIGDPGAVTISHTTPLGDQEAMMKATAKTTSHRTADKSPPCR